MTESSAQPDVVAGDAASVVKRKPIDAFGGAAVPQGLQNAAGIVWRTLVVLIGIFVAIYLVGFAGGVATAMFFALIVAALGQPVQRRLAKHMPNALATFLTLFLMVIVIVLVLGFVVRSIVSEFDSLVVEAQNGIAQIEEWLRTGPLQMDDTAINSLINQAQTWLSGEGVNVAKSLPGTLGSFGDFVTAASVFIFAAFFFLNSGQSIWNWVLSWIPSRTRVEIDDCGQAAWQTLSGYTRGIIIIAFLDGLMVGIGLQLLGVPLAAALAVVVMFGALIPVIGAPIATLFAAVVALATQGIWVALAVVALTVVVGSFDGDILQPLIMGHAVQLHPLAIVSVIAFGTLTFGIMGALLAVPIAGTVYSVAKYLTGRMAPPRLQPPRVRHYPRWFPKKLRRQQPAT